MKYAFRTLTALLALAMLVSLVGCATTYEEYSEYSYIIIPGDDAADSDDAEAPAESGDDDESAASDDAETPADSDDAEAPAESGDDDESAASDDAETPAESGDADEPAASDDQSQSGNTTAKPQSGNNTTAAPQGGNNTTAKPQSGNKTTAKPQSGNDATKAPAQPATTTRPASNRKNNNTIRRNVTIASGKSKVDTYGSTFKGKTYKSMVWTEISTSAYKEELDAFSKKYGCTIKYDQVNFESVRSTLATKLSSGDAYDIVRIQGSWYPRIIISKLLTPLQDAFSTGDCTTADSNKGIDLDKSKFFAWNDELYAVTTYDDSPIIYMYYNKSKYKSFTGHDPMNLYKQGKWTWDQLKKDADQSMKQGQYYSDYALTSHHWQLTNGTELVQEVGGKLTTKLSGNTKYINSLKFIQGLMGLGNGTGLYAPNAVIEQSGGTDQFSNLMNGKILIWPSESDRYEAAYNQARESAAFSNNPANLGICPMPLGPDNQGGAYGGGYLTAFGAGRGSDATAPQLVAALCVYHSTYENKQKAQPTAAEQAVFDKIYKNVNPMDYGYGTADGTLNDLSHQINQRIRKGEDITKTLKSYDNTAATYLKSCLDSQ